MLLEGTVLEDRRVGRSAVVVDDELVDHALRLAELDSRPFVEEPLDLGDRPGRKRDRRIDAVKDLAERLLGRVVHLLGLLLLRLLPLLMDLDEERSIALRDLLHRRGGRFKEGGDPGVEPRAMLLYPRGNPLSDLLFRHRLERVPRAEDRVDALSEREEVGVPGAGDDGVHVARHDVLVELLGGELLDLRDRGEVHRDLRAEAIEEFAALPFPELLERLLPFLQLLLVGLVLLGQLWRRIQAHGLFARAEEDAVERVVVGGWDRVELVVVAAGAGEREAHHASRHRVEPVVDDVVDVVDEAPADGEEAHRREVALFVSKHPIRGELEHEETIVGHVFVVGAHDPVAVDVGVDEAALLAVGVDVAFRVGVAGDVQPVAAPSLSVVGRGEKPVDDLGEGLGRLVGEVRGDLFGRGREADEVVRRAAEEGELVRRRREGQAPLLELREEEGVDRALDEPARLHRGEGHVLHRLEGPVLTRLGEIQGRRLRRTGVRRAAFHPFFEVGDLGRR